MQEMDSPDNIGLSGLQKRHVNFRTKITYYFANSMYHAAKKSAGASYVEPKTRFMLGGKVLQTRYDNLLSRYKVQLPRRLSSTSS